MYRNTATRVIYNNKFSTFVMGKVGLLATNYPLEDKVPLKIQTYSSVNAFQAFIVERSSNQSST